ncbi:hypothetical protein C7999DRAFT_44567 [Corynascus novoguineensis]|uniref:Amidohydrolase-related domain-containing protein n=1 Tax=Corynascus novoguineensis TaxID=1126955 RepID=A0AAN7CL58_9PEZI|nr:hypothetical protein C7999DRAFT_44567 [Corynascus novoguineensis]
MARKAPKGTIAIEEAVLNPAGLSWITESAPLFNPGQGSSSSSSPSTTSPSQRLNQRLIDIHDERLALMDAHGVEYMLLSLTSPGAQGEPDPAKARFLAAQANDWLATQVAQNPAQFGAFAAVSMHNAEDAVAEATRAVRQLGMFGVMVNDYQVVSEGGNSEGKKYYDEAEFRPFWKAIEELGVPVYFHPRYPPAKDLEPGTRYGDRKHILGAAVQFHLDLSLHLYALCSSGVFDEFPNVQVVVGHLGEGMPFNLWRADHWYNKPVKKATRPSKQDYGYYFRHNISVTTSGNFNTPALKFCIEQIGPERCLYSIDYPYDSIAEAQEWWLGVDLPEQHKKLVARENAIKMFKLPLELCDDEE